MSYLRFSFPAYARVIVYFKWHRYDGRAPCVMLATWHPTRERFEIGSPPLEIVYR